MNRRNMLTTLGATALGVGVLLGGTTATFAQDATSPTAGSQAESQDPRAAFEAERAQAYDDFVAALAAELGDQESDVDAAIRTALTQAVDARLSAGEIDEERAAAAKAVIQVSDAPLMAGFAGPGGHGGFEGRGGRGHGGPGFGGPGGEKGMPRPGDDQAQGTLPTAPSATDQGANAPLTSAASATS